jgi:hypothetical protein
MFDAITAYSGQGVDLNLREVPGAIFSGDWRKEPSHFAGLGIAKTRGTLGKSIAWFESTPLSPVKHGYEVLLLQHRGRQTNAEIAAAYLLRTPDLQVGFLGVNFAAGAGLSRALGTPSYEDGSASDPQRRYRTQILALFEVEWRLQSLDHWSLASRIHHRSGVYGLVAPRRVGSNFLTVGLRRQF